MEAIFRDRHDAGRTLGRELHDYADRPDVLMVGLPRGGVPVAAEAADRLHAPLDVMIVRKLGVPGREELAFGAVASGGAIVLNEELVRQLNIPQATIDKVVDRERREVESRERLFRGDRPPLDLADRTVILVDDGIAAGATMRAAVRLARQLKASNVVVAAPVAAPQAVEMLWDIADRVVCPNMPWTFQAVGQWFANFEQTSDEQVRRILNEQGLSRAGRTR